MTATTGTMSVPLPLVVGDWQQHEFAPHQDRPNACIVCGRVRVWRWHFGPFWRLTPKPCPDPDEHCTVRKGGLS